MQSVAASRHKFCLKWVNLCYNGNSMYDQGDELNVVDKNSINEQEMMQFIADKTKASQANIALVLKHEQAYINKAHDNAKGDDVDIDGDDLADYILSRKDVKLDELTVESILDAEMDYLMDKGHAGYVD